MFENNKLLAKQIQNAKMHSGLKPTNLWFLEWPTRVGFHPNKATKSSDPFAGLEAALLAASA
ncbi:TPA: hypothetical protein I8Y34_004813 [Raoultella ornithinolytica]|nr:hypothetical protein [Raoultella ornithinolytica]